MAKKTKRRKKVSPEELEKRNHRKDVRAVFRNAGFTKVLSVSDKEFTFNGHTSDFDDVFVYQNVILFLEYTTTKSSKIRDHLKPKKLIYDEILSNSASFIEFFENKFSKFKETRDQYYDPIQCQIRILYCSKNSVSPKYKEQISTISYFDYPLVKYFKNVAEAVKKSARFEIFSFLGLSNNEVGKDSINSSNGSEDYQGSILPHSYSNFDYGYKVISFYIDPLSLLHRSYVLRRDGWKDQAGVYQRMISKGKINNIRKYLNSKERVFINNIIVTLPSDTKLLNKNGNTLNPNTLTKTEPVTIQIPKRYNVIGLIDGQHRVFSYHEGGLYDEKIGKLREKQNLLVTGIIYPDTILDQDKTKFEANLFLEINSNQSNAKSDIKQAIGLILKPFSSESIAKALINKLNNNGPLEDNFERHFYDKKKIKTTSIVSYGLKPLIKLGGDDSLYKIWSHPQKLEIKDESDEKLLEAYLEFCTSQVNDFIAAAKDNLSSNKWTRSKEEKNKVLTTTAINGFIICLRQIIENNHKTDYAYYKNKLKHLNSFDFSEYKSSQYGRMGRDIYNKYFTNNR
ncbi:hypothetical protein APR41_04390 [Salegentibacter salinarum]|uniref:DGQHR domain-containing protein n=1 Tax=Salegentibacter salinarum TaxID=447422 RepID=A0A2N0TUI1_9FLAO|nr:DGQHR domain-containing protein [Salegentibacter salinarum]PKD18395.1 hypothetical protein APR41_04390 [Salegentibacter salinarum]SKB45052.1 DGQHR domain-containing protein [Salegentibacter salinarum]